MEPGARYVDEETGLELRCTEATDGALRYADRPMTRLPDEPSDNSLRPSALLRACHNEGSNAKSERCIRRVAAEDNRVNPASDW